LFILHPFDPGHSSNRTLAWIFAALSLPVAFFATAAWQQRWWKPAGRMQCTFIAMAGLLFTGFMIFWNLLALPC
jgi:hypothetical protein